MLQKDKGCLVDSAMLETEHLSWEVISAFGEVFSPCVNVYLFITGKKMTLTMQLLEGSLREAYYQLEGVLLLRLNKQ
jgi:hypothetical protein